MFDFNHCYINNDAMARTLAATIVIAIFYGHCHYEDTCHYATTKTGLRKNTLLRILSTYNFFFVFFLIFCAITNCLRDHIHLAV